MSVKLTGYTPGPWEVGRDFPYRVDESGAGNMVCVMGSNEPVSRAEQYANAALIAQSPTLLEQRDKLVKALRFALQDAESRLYMLPIDGEGISQQKDILSVQIGTYRRVLAEVEHESD